MTQSPMDQPPMSPLPMAPSRGSRSLAVYGAGVAAVLVPFLFFVALGWPGSPDSCVGDSPNSCYCEGFSTADVLSGAPGVRQAANTWFNLYALASGLIVALRLRADRLDRRTGPVISSGSWIADACVIAVLFLGLGSMWFHASLTSWAGAIDGLSMYALVGYLVWYTVRRLWDSDLAFWVLYPVTAAAYTVAGALWHWRFASLVLICSLVLAYLVLEALTCVRRRQILLGSARPIGLWLSAVACIATATVFWALSQTGGLLCSPSSILQPHGLIWHPLAGAMAVLLYFYWREEKPAPVAPVAASAMSGTPVRSA